MDSYNGFYTKTFIGENIYSFFSYDWAQERSADIYAAARISLDILFDYGGMFGLAFHLVYFHEIPTLAKVYILLAQN